VRRQTLYLCVALFIWGYGVEISAKDWPERFIAANQAYRKERYESAIKGYRQLIDSGLTNGHLYYNLGNAYFRAGQLGRAILNYERAKQLIPRDPDLSFNLRQARDEVRDIVPLYAGFIASTFFWLDGLTVAELFWVFAVLNVLFWGALLGKMFLRSEWLYYLSLITLILWIIAGTSLGLKWILLTTDDRAVVIKETADVLAGPNPQDTLLFKLHEGTLVHLQRTEDGWSLVYLSGDKRDDDKRGWTPANAVEPIKKGEPK
jgi:tetratricopeptide (TPR) repeat protein